MSIPHARSLTHRGSEPEEGPAGAGHPAGTAHSVAANAANNLVFVPLAANNAFSAFAVPGGGPVDDCEKGCIAVFGRQPSGEDDE
jgi:hypothetical protein